MYAICQSISRKPCPGTLLFLMALYLLSPGSALAADYFVWGRAYSASPMVEEDDESGNPLSGVDPGQIIGENLVAQVPRNLVDVKIINAGDGTELGSYITRYDGGYLVSFSAPSPTLNVRFVVNELATSKTLMDSPAQTLSAWPASNIRFLLISEYNTEIDNTVEYPPPPSPPAVYTGIFTRVGKIEVATEVDSSTVHLINPTTGLASVPQSVADDLAIPPYEDAPFGGNLYLFGAFSSYLYNPGPPDGTIYYRILIENLDEATSGYMDDKLVKTKYTVNFALGTVDTERVQLGPDDAGGSIAQCVESSKPVCYKLTPISVGSDVFWSFPDLLALWRTAGLNGKHKLTIEVFGLDDPNEFDGIDTYTDITLRLDNVAPVAKILPLQTGDFDTPRVYVPSPPDGGIGGDLGGSLLGSFPSDYGGTADPTCAILNMEGADGSKYLAFKLTAHHLNGSDGFLRYWHFRYKRNDGGYQMHIGKRYSGGNMVDYSGAQVSSTELAVSGFENKFLYLKSSFLEPGMGVTMGGCAYRFVIRAGTRTTDGYHYLRHRQDEDLHYLQR